MKQNLGTLDRVIRIIIGVALIGNCALYSLLGINTCRINKK